MDLLIATGNPGKVREYDELLAGIPVTCIRPAGVGIDLEVSESGATYHENAVLKAETYARAGRSHGIWLTLADDSGLEVDALNGRPGACCSRNSRACRGSSEPPGSAALSPWRPQTAASPPSKGCAKEE